MNKENDSISHTDILDQNNSDNEQNEMILDLETKNLLEIGIIKFAIYKYKKEHIIGFDFNNGKRCLISFHPANMSATTLIEKIRKELLQTIDQIEDQTVFNNALNDIEDQIIKNRRIVFDTLPDPIVKNENNYENNSFNQFIESTIKLRNQWIESSLTYEQWQSKVLGKYEKLRQVIEKHYPEAWIFMEFCLSVKSILNIQDFTLPFMGVLIAAPSSMKTMIIQLFRKYPHTFYTDSFTPSSLISHISTKTEQELQKVDMIPKIKDKLVLTPELAPIFTSKEDDLQKVMGIKTRLLDGHGLENDSGSHGHRKYGDTMFVWLGAAVEIPPRVWKILGSLGHKIYFLRPNLRKKTIKDLIGIAKNNNFTKNNQEIEEALFDYLKTFDAAPQIDNKIKIDSQIVKVKWNEEIEGEQSKAIEYIAQLANLLAHLRGTVCITESKGTNYRRYGENNSQHHQQQIIDGQNYDTDFPIIEDPSRAVILLRNIAIAHAISQGRDHLNLTDIPIVIKVALSTAPLRRVKVLDLLLRKGFKGEITTSRITRHLSISQPIATRTMKELDALGIVKIFTVSNYENSEYKIKLKQEFEWFQSSEFLNLKEEFVPLDEYDDENQLDITNEYNENNVTSNKEIPDLSNSSPNHNISQFNNDDLQDKDNDDKENDNIKACDKKVCHTLKQNLLSEAQKENNIYNNQKEIGALEQIINDKYLSNNLLHSQDQLQQNNTNLPIPEKQNQYDNFNSSIETPTIITDLSKENNDIPSSSNSLKHVTTMPHESLYHTSFISSIAVKESNDPTLDLVFRELFDIIKLDNGSSISFNSAIETLCKNNDVTRNYLGDKLTARENRDVRELQLKIIRHPNIEVIKHKPQLLIRCIDDNITNRGEV